MSSVSSDQENDEATTQQEDVRIVQNEIELFRKNKIDRTNVWNMELIDKLHNLIQKHNSYVRNFSNICLSLDATTRVYEVRVDALCNDVQRLYGITTTHPNDRNARKTTSVPNDEGEAATTCDRQQPTTRKRVRRTKPNFNIATARQTNAPLNTVSMPDELNFKLHRICGDTESSIRMLTTILPTKEFIIQLHSDGQFFEQTEREPDEFSDNFEYNIRDDEYTDLSISLKFREELKVRPGCLHGYEMCDTEINGFEQSFHEELVFDQSNYSTQFDDIELPADNDYFGIEMDEDVHVDHDDHDDHDDSDVPVENNNYAIDVRHINKGEYSYNVLSDVQNFWAGPSYWKYKRMRTRLPAVERAAPQRKRRRLNTEEVVPVFIDFNDEESDDNDSLDADFISVESAAANRVRKAHYRRWNPRKLMLPPHINLPKDLFGHYQFASSVNVFGVATTAESHTSQETAESDNDDFFPMQFEDEVPFNDAPVNDPPAIDPPDFDDAAMQTASDISLEPEVEVQILRPEPIKFDLRKKLINMKRLTDIAARSIETQLVTTDTIYNVASNEFQPGKATFRKVFANLEEKKNTFMDKNSNLSTGLALFAVLNVANEDRLHLTRTEGTPSDFDIYQKK